MRETERRRTERLFISIPIRVFGIDPVCGHFEEDTHTVIVNRFGASIVLCHGVDPNSTVRIINLENGLESNFRVVGKIRPLAGTSAVWGVECANERINFWGVEFPSGQTFVRAAGCALLACKECHSRFFWPLTPMEMEILEMTGAIRNYCDQCGSRTIWIAQDPRNRKP